MKLLLLSVIITVANSLNIPRIEVVEADASKISKKLGTTELVVTDMAGKQLPSQVTYDGKLLFQAAVPARGKAKYKVERRESRVESDDANTPFVFGKYFPERMDDIAWENDRVAFRTYGPALQRNNEHAYGFDVWNKRTSRLVVQSRYDGELNPEVSAKIRALREAGQNDIADDLYNAVSYHVDHGDGMDCYKVGSTLGCGTPALLDEQGNIIYPWCWKTYEILDNGPLRFTVRLTYGSADGKDRGEVRTISLDAGSQLCRCEVSYKENGDVAAGIVVHNENPTAYVINQNDGYMGYEDLGDPNQYKEKYRQKQNRTFGKIYTGVVFVDKVNKMYFKEEKGLPGAVGHIIGVKEFKGSNNSKLKTQNSKLVYYFGSGWSRNPETHFRSLADWEGYLKSYAQRVHSPLKVKV